MKRFWQLFKRVYVAQLWTAECHDGLVLTFDEDYISDIRTEIPEKMPARSFRDCTAKVRKSKKLTQKQLDELLKQHPTLCLPPVGCYQLIPYGNKTYYNRRWYE